MRLRICSITGQGPSLSFQPGKSRIPSVGLAAWRGTRPPYLHQSLWMSQTVAPMCWQLWSSSAGVVSIQPTYLTYLRSCTAKLFDFSCDYAPRGLDLAAQAPACLREEEAPLGQGISCAGKGWRRPETWWHRFRIGKFTQVGKTSKKTHAGKWKRDQAGPTRHPATARAMSI